MSDQEFREDAFAAMDVTVSRLNKSWHTLRQTGKTWNIKGARQNTDKMRPLIEGLAGQWQDTDNQLASLIDSIKNQLGTPSYAEELARELKSAGVQFSGDFPQYLMPPFKLVVSVDGLEGRLSLGRKSERTSDLNPKQLAAWVAVRYKKVLSRKFNAPAFMKDLLEAYLIANRLIFREKDQVWGRAVPLTELYAILTVSQSSRQDYPRQFFLYDLGLLIESTSLVLDGYRFELGFARAQSKALVVVDSSGRENHFSSLTIYLDEGGQ